MTGHVHWDAVGRLMLWLAHQEYRLALRLARRFKPSLYRTLFLMQWNEG